MGKTPTIAQVASLANVSPASVSMILNDKSLNRFAPQTVKAVRDAAQALGYQLKQRVSSFQPIRIICPSVMNPYYALLIQGMQQAAVAANCDTTIHTTYWNKALERRIIESFHSQNTSGAIFAMIPQQPELAGVLNRRLPVVAVGDRSSELSVDTVNISNRRAGEMIGEHLLGLGHRHVAYISTTLDESHSARVLRLKGLEYAFSKEASFSKVHVVSMEVTPKQELETAGIEYEVGFTLAQKCLKELPEVTAFVAINDMVAYGVLDALKQSGWRVPEDFSVCGFDNIYPSGFSRMSLTTVEHFIQARGQSAFLLLTDKIKGDRFDRHDALTRIEYQSHLVIRDTTAPPRKALEYPDVATLG